MALQRGAAWCAGGGVVQAQQRAVDHRCAALVGAEAQHRAGQRQHALQWRGALQRELQAAVTLVGGAQPEGRCADQQRHIQRGGHLAVQHGATLQHHFAQVGGLGFDQQPLAALHSARNSTPTAAKPATKPAHARRRRARWRACTAWAAARADALSCRKPSAGASATPYCAAQAGLGRACAHQASAKCSSGSRHSPPRPWACRPPASARRRSCSAERASSSAQPCSRRQIRIRLSWAMSITVSACNGSGSGGIRNERSGLRKTSITAHSASAGSPVTSHSAASRAGRRTPRGSVARSVSARSSRSQVARAASSGRAAQACSA